VRLWPLADFAMIAKALRSLSDFRVVGAAFQPQPQFAALVVVDSPPESAASDVVLPPLS
jgi:hypothetical protein